MKGYVAQINGFTIQGTLSQIQKEWDSLKEHYDFGGETIKFFEAEFYNNAFVISNFTPVKTLTIPL